MLLHTLIKERLTALDDFSNYTFTGKNKKTEKSEVEREAGKIKSDLIEKLFKMFPVQQLVDSDFHLYLFKFIKEDQNIATRKKMSKVLGESVIVALIK